MRNLFIDTLTNIARQDSRVVLLTGDLGFSVLEKFMQEFPDRFYNVGVSEQNMLGLATGLAESGFIPFTYSIAPFSLLRPYEFVRNGPVLHNFPVRIVAIGPGFEYGNLGSTHHLIEDIAVTRLFPKLTTYSPINSENAKCILENSYAHNGPIYYRIGKNQHSLSDKLAYTQEDHLIKLSTGSGSVCVFGIGSIVEEMIAAVNGLNILGKNISSYAITKIDSSLYNKLLEILRQYKSVISIEAHYINGGIGSMLAEVIAENNLTTRLYRMGVSEFSDGVFGSTEFMHKKHNIDKQSLISLVEEL